MWSCCGWGGGIGEDVMDTADVIIIIVTRGSGRVGYYIYIYFYALVVDELSCCHHRAVEYVDDVGHG